MKDAYVGKKTIDVYLTNEKSDAPSISDCRYAALRVNKGGYVVYDRLYCRIVNGVYSSSSLEEVLELAQAFNDGMEVNPCMSPNGSALGLIYPQKG